MKARLIQFNKKTLLLCTDGTIANADEAMLKRLFVGFTVADKFHGKDGRWDEACNDMKNYKGRDLAWVDDNNLLVIKENPFICLVESVVDEDYVTIQEYADEHGRFESRIKTLCQEGRIPGAIKKGNRWFVPRNAPYPKDARYSGVNK